MTPERWQQVKDILNTALELRGDERTAFLAEVCDGDPSLRDEVDSLIQSYEEADQLLETPAVEPPLPPPKPGPPEIGMRVGHYKIVAQIAKGGMGAVFRAVRADREFDQVVAIKILRRAMDHDFLIRRFKHERQILAALDHPNIAKLLDGDL